MKSPFYGQSSYYLLEQDWSLCEAKLILEKEKKKSTSNSDLYIRGGIATLKILNNYFTYYGIMLVWEIIA